MDKKFHSCCFLFSSYCLFCACQTNGKKLWYCSCWHLDVAELWFIASRSPGLYFYIIHHSCCSNNKCYQNVPALQQQMPSSSSMKVCIVCNFAWNHFLSFLPWFCCWAHVPVTSAKSYNIRCQKEMGAVDFYIKCFKEEDFIEVKCLKYPFDL